MSIKSYKQSNYLLKQSRRCQ